jgi:CheY-like chemotaxis protein
MMQNNTVLLVDDDPDFLAANGLALETAGFKVYEAGNSARAMEIALAVSPAVAVLDVMMDEPDEGFALARALRQEERTKDIRLVLLSSVNEVNRRKGLAYRFSDRDRDERWLPVDKVLEKPIRPKKLVAVLKELMGGES